MYVLGHWEKRFSGRVGGRSDDIKAYGTCNLPQNVSLRHFNINVTAGHSGSRKVKFDEAHQCGEAESITFHWRAKRGKKRSIVWVEVRPRGDGPERRVHVGARAFKWVVVTIDSVFDIGDGPLPVCPDVVFSEPIQ
jgi:hypothetical protein